MFIPHSELILNSDKSIYHLKLKPGDLAKRIITVGDPSRIDLFRPYLKDIRVEVTNREFTSITGYLGDKEISIISTGIGTDNIDIVINEIDALFNINFENRKVKEEKTILEIIRVGTSGAIREDIDVHDVIISEFAVGLDGLMHYYPSEMFRDMELEQLINRSYHAFPIPIYAVQGDRGFSERFSDMGKKGITLTASGFYGPQSRQIRGNMTIDLPEVFEKISYQGMHFTNLEMETSGIYGISRMLGHRPTSLNLILANRITGKFSADAYRALGDFVDDVVAKLKSI